MSALRIAIQDLENQIEEQRHKISNTPMPLLRVRQVRLLRCDLLSVREVRLLRCDLLRVREVRLLPCDLLRVREVRLLPASFPCLC